MVQELTTWCTVHYDKGEHVRGLVWPFAFSEPGGKPRQYELDLCSECGEQVAALFASLVDNARQIGGSKAPLTRTLTPSAGTDPATACPLCTAHPVSMDALDSHLVKHHDTSLAERDGTATLPCEVDGCPRHFKNRTGLKAHLRVRHADYYAQHFGGR